MAQWLYINHKSQQSLDQLAKWLIWSANNENDGPMRKKQRRVSFGGEGLPAPTPARRMGRDNPRSEFEEDRYYSTTKTGATPCKGKPKFPKQRSSNWRQDQARLSSCPGVPYPIADGRFKCYICSSHASVYCPICKRAYCFVSRDQQLQKLIADGTEVVGFLDGVRPPSKLNFKASTDDNHPIKVHNSCFHVRHQQQIAKVIHEKRAMTASAEEADTDEIRRQSV